METETNKLINEVQKHGYDIFIKENVITILYEGYVKTTPLDNILNLMNGKLMPLPIKDVALLLISQHKTKKELEEGKYDNLPPLTEVESREKFLSMIKPKNL